MARGWFLFFAAALVSCFAVMKMGPRPASSSTLASTAPAARARGVGAKAAITGRQVPTRSDASTERPTTAAAGADAASAPSKANPPGQAALLPSGLERVLNRTRTGRALAEIFRAGMADDEDIAAAARHSELVESLKKDPVTSFRELEASMTQLPRQEYPRERWEILELMAMMPGMREQTRALALKEAIAAQPLTRPDPRQARTEEELNQALSTGPDMVLPLAAHQVFLDQARDFGDALKGTLEVVRRQRHEGIRYEVVAQLARAYPSENKRIVELFSSMGLRVSSLAGERP